MAIAWLIVLICAIAVGSYFIVNNIQECTSNPLDYAVKSIKDKFEVSSVSGQVEIIGTDIRQRQTLYFGDRISLFTNP